MANLTQITCETKKKKKAWYQSPKLWRQSVMLFFFGLLSYIAWIHQAKGGGPRGTPSIEAYCPFGGFENLYFFITTGGYIRRLEASTMIIFAAVILLTIVASRGFCGWVCPFGSVQEWIGWVGRKIFRKRFNPTGSWDHALRYLKYVVLVVIIALTWYTGTLVFREYDPFLAFFHFGEGFDEMPYAYAFLGISLAGSLMIERFFCKYFCPLGAVLGLLGRLGLTKVEREPSDCKGCNICQKVCYAHIDFLNTTRITDPECNHCLDCVEVCPKPNVLAMKGSRWQLSHPAYAGIVLLSMFGLVGVTKLSGHWKTKPEMVSFKNASGKLDAGQIRGWMTLKDIHEGYGIPMDKIYEATGLPRSVKTDVRLNRIGQEFNVKFEPEGIRDVVDAYLGGKTLVSAPPLPVRTQSVAAPPAQGGTPVPAAAPAVQKAATERNAEGQKTGEKKGDGKGAGKGGKKQADSEHGGEEPAVRGYMTLNEIGLKTGVPVEYLRRKLNLPESVSGQVSIREWMHEQGKSVQQLRDAVEEYQKLKGK